MTIDQNAIDTLSKFLIKTISETNGISLANTLDLMLRSPEIEQNTSVRSIIESFVTLLFNHRMNKVAIKDLLSHPFSLAMFTFFKNFPLRFHEEHIHLTGSLTPEFIFPRLMAIINGKNGPMIQKRLVEIYGENARNIQTPEDIRNLICLKDSQLFNEYLKILFLPKLILDSKKAHYEAAYHLAENLYNNFNIGRIRLKFTMNRSGGTQSEQIPLSAPITSEDVVMGLYEGLVDFKSTHPDFDFVLSPSFRKEPDYFDHNRFQSKKDDIEWQIDEIISILKKHPELTPYLRNIDTVGDETSLFKKSHFMEMRQGFRRLQYKGFHIRSHHGESWTTLKRGVQAVDNALNIWRIDALEHGIALGINPNYYFHSIVDETIRLNRKKQKLSSHSPEFNEIMTMEWGKPDIKNKIEHGTPLSKDEVIQLTKTKFHTAIETEYYQHDVLNHMINKDVALIALPTSNLKLTGRFHYYKDHPFSWWEKKGLKLGIGTDNYITLRTNYIQELLTLLYSDPEDLKITKLLIIGTREKRRAYISNLLWNMHKQS